MAFPRPYNDRDFSMYSTSTSENEGSVRRANRDLDRCAYILNEMLDNGAGILDAVKKRKSLTSPRQEKAIALNKRARQSNRTLSFSDGENKNPSGRNICSSTPASSLRSSRTRRQRSCSANSVGSYQSRQTTRPSRRRNRSLSETGRTCNSALRNSRSLEAKLNALLNQSTLSDSNNSIAANASTVASEVDTLTGVHLDNSSQFGIPPVFNAKGEKIKTLRRHKQRSSSCQNVGWLRPQMSCSTQTLENNLPEGLMKINRSKKQLTRTKSSKPQLHTSVKRSIYLSSAGPDWAKTKQEKIIKIPAAYEGQELVKTLSCTAHKENDVDELMEKTLLAEEDAEGDMRTEQTPVTHSAGDPESSVKDRPLDELRFKETFDRIKALASTTNLASNVEFKQTLDQLFTKVMYSIRESSKHRLKIDQLLAPFQREAQELKEEIKFLKSKLQEQRKQTTPTDQDIAAQLSVRVVAQENTIDKQDKQLDDMRRQLQAEKQRCEQLVKDRDYYFEQSENMRRENQALYVKQATLLSNNGSEANVSDQKLQTANQRLRTLQQTLRLLHTRITDISSTCEMDTAKKLGGVLELCSQRLLDSMNYETNTNNNSSKPIGQDLQPTDQQPLPEHLVYIVSQNLTRNRLESQTAVEAGQSLGSGLTKTNYQESQIERTEPEEERVSNLCHSGRSLHTETKNNKKPQSPDTKSSELRLSVADYFKKYPLTNSSPSTDSFTPVESQTSTSYSNKHYKDSDCGSLPKSNLSSTSKRTNSNSLTGTGTKAMSSHSYTPTRSKDYNTNQSQSDSIAKPSPFNYNRSDHNNQLHSTLQDDEASNISYEDVTVIESDPSSTSIATSMAESAFQEGLAQLDANIARLQESLRHSKHSLLSTNSLVE